MNKIKKIFISIGAFAIASISKIGGVVLSVSNDFKKYGEVQPAYGIQALYGPPTTIGEKILRIGKPIILVILFIIGLIVLLNKKIAKKTKVIIISILVLIGIIGTYIFNFIANIDRAA